MTTSDWVKVGVTLVLFFIGNGVTLSLALHRMLAQRFDKITAEAKAGRQEIGKDLGDLRDELRGLRVDLMSVMRENSKTEGLIEGHEIRISRLERRNGGTT